MTVETISAHASLEGWAPHYLGELDPRDPRISPLFAGHDGLPPLLLLAGEHEPLTLPWLAESRDAWFAIAALVEQKVEEARP
jgi:acetyl esterase/lipase